MKISISFLYIGKTWNLIQLIFANPKNINNGKSYYTIFMTPLQKSITMKWYLIMSHKARQFTPCDCWDHKTTGTP